MTDGLTDGPWALRLDDADGPRARLAALRHRPGLRARREGAALWVRGEALDPDLARALRALGGARFGVGADEALTPAGARLPAGRLPAGPWRPLGELVALAAPAARPAQAAAPAPARLRARRADAGPAPALLRAVDAAAWAAWAVTAPAVRLAPLSVAARADADEVLVRGAPPPPLPAAGLVLDGPVAVPAGWTLDPPIDGATLGALLGLGEGDLVLVTPRAPAGPAGPAAPADPAAPVDVDLERVPATAFAPASRAAARDLAEALTRDAPGEA